MAHGTPNPHPSRTVWAMMAAVAVFVIGVGYFALSYEGPGIKLSTMGGFLPAAFVVIAVIVGALSVAFFLHRHPHQK